MEKLTPAIDLRRGDKLQTVLLIWYESRDEDTAGNRFQQALQSSRSGAEHPEIVAAIEDFKPTAPIGVSTVGKLFSRELVETMSRTNQRPIIFALSNPIEKHECLPEEVYARSGDKVAYAGGVQFPPVHLGGQTFPPSQAHNLDIFPAVGMAIYATNTKRVTDEMFIEAAHAVADQVAPEQLKLGMLFPPQGNLLEVAVQTPARVAQVIFDCWLGPRRSSDQYSGLDPASRLQAAVCQVCVVN